MFLAHAEGGKRGRDADGRAQFQYPVAESLVALALETEPCCDSRQTLLDCAPFFHPLADGIAVEGMRLIHDFLPRAVADGSDLEARSHMLIASSMGATAFQKGLGAMHSLSHPCGANLDTHHGLTNAVVMPYVLAWNRRAIEQRLARVAAWLGLKRQSYQGFFDWILELRATIGIPSTLAALGVREEHAVAFAPQAFADPSTGGNPLPMTVADFEQLYLNCIRS